MQKNLHFVSDAVYAFAHALKSMHAAVCGDVRGLCEGMKPHNLDGEVLLEHLGQVNFTGDYILLPHKIQQYKYK